VARLALFAFLLSGTLACSGGADHPSPSGATTLPLPEAAPLELSPSAEAQACVGVEAETRRLPVDLFALVDGSASMSDATSTGVSKWYATKAAFHDFLAAAPRDMRFGLSLFPIPGDDTASCAESYYRENAVPFGDLALMASGALARLDAVAPQGQTPTGPALAAALELASRYGAENSERSVVVVLATDGLPTTCAPTDGVALARLAENALRGPGHVRTLVVASKSLEGGEGSAFGRIAAAGGTERELIIDPRADFAAQLQRALGDTAGRNVACDLAVPEPPAGQQLDYDAVNVVVAGERRVTLPRVAGPGDCSSGGWYYDVDPARGAPARLNICKQACERVSDDSAAALRVEIGCKTVVK
jgi:hypothetical protein